MSLRSRPTEALDQTLKPNSSYLISNHTTQLYLHLLLDDPGHAKFNTEKFKAHCTRSASTSAAASAGIITNQILETADWNSKSVFQQFYYKPTSSNAVGVSVLSAAPTSSLRTSRYVIQAFRNVIA